MSSSQPSTSRAHPDGREASAGHGPIWPVASWSTLTASFMRTDRSGATPAGAVYVIGNFAVTRKNAGVDVAERPFLVQSVGGCRGGRRARPPRSEDGTVGPGG